MTTIDEDFDALRDRAKGEIAAAMREAIDANARALTASNALAAAEAVTAGLRADLAELGEKYAAALARIAELEAGTDPDPDPPAAPRPLLGACPLKGAASASGIANVVARWGAGVAVRLFASGGLSTAPAPGDAGRIHISWKPTTTITEAQVRAAVENLPAGSKVTVWHEPDVKVRKGSNTAAGMKARAREFYTLVKRIRPDLVVVAVLSEWTFNPAAPKYNPLDYIELGTFDVLALDLDGGNPGPRDYLPSVKAALAWMAANGVTRWTVAEYGWKLAPGFTAADRAALMREQTTALMNLTLPPEEICYFELDSGDPEAAKYILAGADKAEWERLIALEG